MVYRQLAKQSAADREAISGQSDRIRARLDDL